MARAKKQDSVDRRERIVQAAVKCFVRNGVAQTTLREIACEAKVDQPLVHYYFKSTEDLYSAVVEVVLASLREATTTTAQTQHDAVRTLTRYIEGTFEWAKENPGYFSIWMYFYYLSTFTPGFARLNRSIRDAGRDRIALMIHRGVEQGAFAVTEGQSVQALAGNIQGLMTGNCIVVASEERGEWARYMRMTVQGCLGWLGA
jgi:AcrR family transcriptional regulator